MQTPPRRAPASNGAPTAFPAPPPSLPSLPPPCPLQVRRKGQVVAVQANPGGGYVGEATGIKAKIAKSRRF